MVELRLSVSAAQIHFAAEIQPLSIAATSRVRSSATARTRPIFRECPHQLPSWSSSETRKHRARGLLIRAFTEALIDADELERGPEVYGGGVAEARSAPKVPFPAPFGRDLGSAAETSELPEDLSLVLDGYVLSRLEVMLALESRADRALS